MERIQGEHILACLSSAPSNAKIIQTAAEMASAFQGNFTALYIETPEFETTSEEDKKRLRANIRLAKQLGASVETVCGEDVAFQIAEFARLSGVTRIVLGRSSAAKKGYFAKPALTDRLIASAPNVEIYIIPDSAVRLKYQEQKKKELGGFRLKDALFTAALLFAATLLGWLFSMHGFSDANIITVYILGVLLISVVTAKRFFSFTASALSVFLFNFFFTDPRFTFMASDKDYPITFLVMFLAAFISSSLAVKLKEHAKQSAQAAFRTRILFDTNQILQQAGSREEIFQTAASQLIKLMERGVIVYPETEGRLGKPEYYSVPGTDTLPIQGDPQAAEWVFYHNRHAGAGTERFSNLPHQYLAIRSNHRVYGVFGIEMGEKPMEGFENDILLSILGECALALENEKNAREKEEAAILAKNEQLRANLLRTLSHDLRTPLTSISGNASNLLSNGERFSEEEKQSLYLDIYDDSLWLINLVENLLSVSRMEQGTMKLNQSAQLMDEVVEEALRHVNRKSVEHRITVEYGEELLLARMDGKLIVQVLINIVDNAIKYTPKGSEIRIRARRDKDKITVEIADNGPGIPDEKKKQVFEMFYSGANKVADSRRSLGLGLSLCKSIVNAHGGTIAVTDNTPQGAIFTFTLPAGEVELHE